MCAGLALSLLQNSIVLVSICRDKLASTLLPAVSKQWGDVVDGSAIAGFCSMGKAGIANLVQHAPQEYERTRLIFIVMPHISISEEGQIGAPIGYLGKIREELERGHVDVQLDPLDIEYSTVKQKLFEKVKFGGRTPSLAALTDAAADLAHDNVVALIKATISLEISDVAVVAGVQIHGPEAKDYVYVKKFYSIVQGDKQDHTDDLAGIVKKAGTAVENQSDLDLGGAMVPTGS